MRNFAWYGRLSTKDKQDPTLEIDRNADQVRLKALVSSAFGQAKDLTGLENLGNPAVSAKAIPLRGFEPRFPD